MLEDEIKSLPSSPGIYQYFDKDGHLLYIGKAKNLKNRVKSYFKFTPRLAPSNNLSLRIRAMIELAHRLEYIKVNSEHDAFILENSLIKQLKPKYNILLRDDKTYPYVVVNLDDEFPRLEITRKVVKGKNIKYFGPFSSGARALLDALYLLFPLVQKKGCLKGKKACLFYQINRCLAPCQGLVSKDEYRDILEKAISLIHHTKPLLSSLEQKMLEYAQNENYEQAALIRDMMQNIKSIEPQNQIDLASLENFDMLGVYGGAKELCAMRFFIREGKIVSTSHSIIHTKNGYELEEIYKQMILGFYQKNVPLPINTIYTAHDISECDELSSILEDRFDKKVHIKNPKRGEKASLARLVLTNAKEILLRHEKSKSTKLQNEIYSYFELNSYPYSIETFDNSHLGGRATVGAIVAWEGEGFEKSKYRHYHLKGKDEYAQMRELLTNRALRFDKDNPPDLWVIDGGKTLLNLAHEIIQSSGANVDVVAIAKEKIDAKAHRAKGGAKDIIYTLQRSYKLSENDVRLQFLQRLRDEAHRFAITFHRKTKAKQDKESSRLKQRGLSDAKIKKLLLYFGTFEAIESANFDELEKVVGKREAKKLK